MLVDYRAVDSKWKKGAAEMVITDNWGYVKQAMTGLPGLLMLPSVALAESKFLPLFTLTPFDFH